MCKKNKTNFQAFTLIELLVVIAIIGLLSTLAGVALNSARQKAKEVKATGDVKQIFTAVALLVSDTNRWPGGKTPDEDECGSGTNNEICDDGCAYGLSACQSGIVCNDGNFSNWKGPYMASIPKDPWGNEYFFDTDYEVDGVCGVAVGSYGPNGEGRNLYDADDIILVIPSQ